MVRIPQCCPYTYPGYFHLKYFHVNSFSLTRFQGHESKGQRSRAVSFNPENITFAISTLCVGIIERKLYWSSGLLVLEDQNRANKDHAKPEVLGKQEPRVNTSNIFGSWRGHSPKSWEMFFIVISYLNMHHYDLHFKRVSVSQKTPNFRMLSVTTTGQGIVS